MIPVAIGVADPARARRLAAQLVETGEYRVVAEARTSTVLLDVLAEEDVVVVVVDEEIGPLPALDLIREVGTNHPQIAVVLMATDPTPDLFATAMGVGARGLLPVDPTLEEIESRLAPATAWAHSVRRHLGSATQEDVLGARGTMVAVAGAKGGVGSTTLALHTALLAARSGRDRRVCLVDMDLQSGDIGNLLDVKHRRSVVDLVEVADDLSVAVLQDALFVHESGLSMLLAPAEGERGEEVNSKAARKILGALKSRYDVVIVDAGSVMTAASTVAVEMADRVALVVTPDVLALKAAKRQTQLWERLQVCKPEDIVVVLNRHDRSSDVQPDTAKRVLGSTMAETVLPADWKALQPVVNTGDPRQLGDGSLRRALLQIAVELGVIATEAPATASTSSRGRRAKLKRDAGQAVIETVATAPLLLLLVLLLWQMALTGLTFVFAGNASDVGARTLSVSSAMEAGRQADDSLPAAWERRAGYDVIGSSPADPVRSFRVRLEVPLLFPGVGDLLTITSSSAVSDEP
jgi:pilus assembly protein CpaE